MIVLVAATFVNAMELEEQSSKESASSLHNLSKLATLYVNTLNNYDPEDPEKSKPALTKIFGKSHTDEELRSVEDIKIHLPIA